MVTLEAVPAAGWQFDNWSGDLTGSTNPDTITMDSDKAVTANFSQIMHSLDLTGLGSGSVTVDGTPRALPWSGSFAWGSVVTLEAVPVAGWQFANWSGDLAGSANPDTITMDADKAVVANFSQIMHSLDLTGVGSGSVTVNGTPQSLPWSGSFAWGTVVTLEAVPAAGWQFDNWSADLTGSANPDTITMDADKSVTANFSQIMHSLDLTGVGSGSVTVDGTPRALPWSGSFAWGTVVTLEAVPAAGWQFDNWSGDLAGSTNPDTITMDADKAVTAHFSQAFALSLDRTGNGSVTVDGTPQTLPWSAMFPPGTTVTLDAVPDPGWQFDNWTGDYSWADTPITVTMDADKSITANFSPQTTLTITDSPPGSGSSVRVDSVLHALPWTGYFDTGTSVTLEAVAGPGYEFDSWSGDRSWSGPVLTTTITEDTNLVANFVVAPGFSLSISGSGGSVLVDSNEVTLPWSGNFDVGETVTLEAVPAPGWGFDGWSGDVTSSDNPIFVTMNNHTSVTANFSRLVHTLDLAFDGSGTVVVNGSTWSLPGTEEISQGSIVELEALPEYGWRFVGWSGDVSDTDNPVVFIMDSDKTITAEFILPSTYFLTVQKTGSGTVLVDDGIVSLPWTGEFTPGTEVVLDVVLEEDEEFEAWSGALTGSDLPATVVTDADKEVTAHFGCIARFPDVPCEYWAFDAIETVAEVGLVFGYPDGFYRPRLGVDRAQMASFVARAMLFPAAVPTGPAEATFPDVPPEFWAFEAVEYTVDSEVVQGYGDGSYQPAYGVTRGQMAVFIARSICTPTGEAGLADYVPPGTPTFPDVPESYWSYKHIEYLAERGAVKGYPDGMYRPTAWVTRDQMAVYVYRVYNLE